PLRDHADRLTLQVEMLLLDRFGVHKVLLPAKEELVIHRDEIVLVDRRTREDAEERRPLVLALNRPDLIGEFTELGVILVLLLPPVLESDVCQPAVETVEAARDEDREHEAAGAPGIGITDNQAGDAAPEQAFPGDRTLLQLVAIDPEV